MEPEINPAESEANLKALEVLGRVSQWSCDVLGDITLSSIAQDIGFAEEDLQSCAGSLNTLIYQALTGQGLGRESAGQLSRDLARSYICIGIAIGSCWERRKYYLGKEAA